MDDLRKDSFGVVVPDQNSRLAACYEAPEELLRRDAVDSNPWNGVVAGLGYGESGVLIVKRWDEGRSWGSPTTGATNPKR